MSKWAAAIDEAHKVYRDSIGTLNEEPAYDFLVAVVRRAQQPQQPTDDSCAGFCDPDAVLASIQSPTTKGY